MMIGETGCIYCWQTSQTMFDISTHHRVPADALILISVMMIPNKLETQLTMLDIDICRHTKQDNANGMPMF